MATTPSIDPTDATTWPAVCPTCDETLHKTRQCMGHVNPDTHDGRHHCDHYACKGQTVCGAHGGRSPRGKAAGLRRVEEAQARNLAVTYGSPVAVDPHTALLGELHRTAGHVAWLGELVAQLHHEDDSDPTVLGNPSMRDPEEPHVTRSGLKQYTRTEKFTVEQESVWLTMYRNERAHLAKVAKDCIAAGIAERQVRLHEAVVTSLARTISEIVTGLGHDLLDPGVKAVVEPAMLRSSTLALSA